MSACQARVIALFSYRYDAHLVPDLIENISGAVHGWAAYDDRAAEGPLSDEPARRNLLLAAAREMGADWILAVDPDERFESALAERIGEFTAAPPQTRWHFNLREMFTPATYRVDGLWGRKRAMRLFPCLPGSSAAPAALHGRWIADDGAATHRNTGINLYHLNMISPERRQRRRDLYAAADPARLHQAIGYDYLVDERGAQFEEVSPARGYRPGHRDDGGLWSAPDALVGTPAADPAESRLWLMAALRGASDPGGAWRVARDLAQAKPGDADLHLLAAAAALDAVEPEAALASAEAALAAGPNAGAPHLMRSRALAALGRRDEARAAARAGMRLVPKSLLARQQAMSLARGVARFAAPGALWRRWASGPATLHEGPRVRRAAPIAVVVLAHRAPPELAEAVASLRRQKPAPEIVVVNSGGGDASRQLAGHLPHVRLIEVEPSLYVGAIRNIGIDASSAPVIAFLAADCIARPGWTAGRLAHHDAGTEAVSSPVLPHRPRNLIAKVTNALLHHSRRRETPEDAVRHFGVSYARAALVRTGYFPTGLRVSEDSAFNQWLRRTTRIAYARDVLTLHRYPTRLWAGLRDARARGARRAPHPPFARAHAGDPHLDPDWTARAEFRLQGPLSVPIAAGTRGWRLAVWRWLLRAMIRQENRGTRDAHAAASEAVRLREAAIATAPQDPGAARALAERAVALAPQNVPCLMAAARLRLDGAAARDAADAAADREAAIGFLRRASALRPDLPRPVAGLCAALNAAGRAQEAVDAAEAAALSAPHVPELWELAGRLALKRKEARRAHMMFQMALVAAPARGGPHSLLAWVHERAGRTDLGGMRRAMAGRLAEIAKRAKAKRRRLSQRPSISRAARGAK